MALAGSFAGCVVVLGEDGNPPRSAVEFDSREALIAAINSYAASMKYPVKVWNKEQEISKSAMEWLTRIRYDFHGKGEPINVVSGNTISHTNNSEKPLLGV